VRVGAELSAGKSARLPDIPCWHIGAASGIDEATAELLGKEGGKTGPVTIDAAVREGTRAADNEKARG
jgi:hypothetical protein